MTLRRYARYALLALALSLALVLAACGADGLSAATSVADGALQETAQEDASPDESAQEDATPDASAERDSSPSAAAQEDATPDESAQADTAPDQSAQEVVRSDDGEETSGAGWTATLDVSDPDSYTFLDGDVLLLTCTYQSPQISVASGDAADAAVSAALDAIQSDVTTVLTAFLEDADVLYEAALSDRQDAPDIFASHSMEISFSMARSDNRVLSILVWYSYYLGGAHGSSLVQCLNYDMTTGARITLDALGDGCVEVLRSSVLAQAGEMTEAKGGNAQGQVVFDDYADYVDDVITDDTVYFSDEGLVVVSNEYMLQPYASGIIEFTVPYGDLSGVLPAAYQR